jgi:protein tyrosine kinase modulator
VPVAAPNSSKFLSAWPGFSPLSLLRAIWKNKLLGGAVATAVTITGVIITYRLPAVYQAQALVLVDPQKIPERFVASTVNIDVQDRLAMINQEIQSSTRLQKIVDDFNLYPKERLTHTPEEVIGIMRRDIQTILERGVGGNRPGAFRIIYQGPDPKIVAQVVERITQFYIDENVRSREQQAQGTYTFMESKLREAKKALDQQELALTQYKLQHTGELPEQENSLNATLTRLQLELQGNQDAINRAQQNKTVLENTLSAAEAVEATLNRQAMQVAAARAAAKEADAAKDPSTDPIQPQSHRPSDDVAAQLAALQLRYSDQHPEIRRLRALLSAMRRQEREEDAKAKLAALHAPTSGKGGTEQIEPDPLVGERAQAHERVVSLKAQLNATSRELQSRAAEMERISREMNSYEHRIEQLPVRDLEMSALTRNFDFSRTYYNSLLSKETEAGMATDLERRQKAETFKILDPPTTPTKPFKPKRDLLCVLSAMLGLALGMVVAVARELKAGVLLGEWELPSGVTILGRVSHIEPSFVTPLDDNHDKPDSGKRDPLKSLQRAASSSLFVTLENKMGGSIITN